jgi:hypothetical protein
MKRLFFGLIATVMFINNVNAQSAAKTKIFCVTLSCCGIGPFSVDIWSETTCHYVSSGRIMSSYSFNTKDDLKEVEVKEDVILAGQFAKNGDNLVLPMGKYSVKNGQIEFTASTTKARQYCYIKEVSGTLFGHDYEYSIKICVSFGRMSNGVVSINPQLKPEQVSQILKSDDKTIELKESITIKEDGLNYTLKAGKYIINEDGNAYLQNVKLK